MRKKILTVKEDVLEGVTDVGNGQGFQVHINQT